ncbi:hypothetical protein [Arhodomonas sp. SL1]|uniref:hypothetical protein n=1 Tax=Arhodomonas sp. SL1 TaxID=3425691 RepID=UPI003F880B3A
MNETQRNETMDILRQWSELNERLARESMNIFQETLQEPRGMDREYQKALKTAREAVEEAIRLEREAVEAFEKGNGDNEALKEPVRAVATMTRTGIDLRERMWSAWFQGAEQMLPASGSRRGGQPFPDLSAVFSVWQDLADSASQAMQQAGQSAVGSSGKAEEASSGAGEKATSGQARRTA